MNIEQKIDDLTRAYQRIHKALGDYLPNADPENPDEHLEDLVMLRDTALVLIGGLVEFRDSDSIPFDFDVNELSLTVDEFITTTNTVVDQK